MEVFMTTQKRVKQLFDYDEKTGLFTRISPVRKANVGDIAGTVAKNGYITISVDCKRYYAHRLAFLFMTGDMPKQVDHKDRNRSNNKWSNLRKATHSNNEANKPAKKGCKSRHKGVSVHHSTGMWRSRIKVNKKEISLGLFKCETDAAIAYNAAAKKYFGEYCILNEV